jgi:uncharacterized membrane protein YkvA (DUF1232 family)
MKLFLKTKYGIKSVLTQGFSFIYIFIDKRVPIYIKLILLISIGYILSPIDIIPDSFVPFGHLDDLFIVRMIYYIIKKFIRPEILSENTDKANAILLSHKEHKLKFLIFISIVWIAIITFLVIYFIRKIYLKKNN